MGMEYKTDTFEVILSRVKSLIEDLLRASQDKNSLQLPEITLETDLVDDLGLDSVEMMDLSTAIAEEFKINLDTPPLFDGKKVKDIVNYVVRLKNKN